VRLQAELAYVVPILRRKVVSISWLVGMVESGLLYIQVSRDGADLYNSYRYQSFADPLRSRHFHY
jgi:hypothetical protein